MAAQPRGDGQANHIQPRGQGVEERLQLFRRRR